MLVNSILVPFLAFISPFQNTVVDDIRAIRLDSSVLAVTKYKQGALAGAAITTVLISHHIFRCEMFGHPPWPQDVPIPRPPPYIENRISRPYTSSLLRNQCIAQRFPTPPPPTCTNRAARPSFEYTEKSPARPAFPQHRSACAPQPRTVFVGSDMTFLHPLRSENVLPFPEPALPALTSCRRNSTSTPVAPIAATLFGQGGTLARLLGLVGIWIGLVVVSVFRPSVYASAACVDKTNGDLDVNSVCGDLAPHRVVPCSALDITQESATRSQCGTVETLHIISVDDCQGQGSIEDKSVSSPVLTSSVELETQRLHESFLPASLPALPVENSTHSIVPALVVLSPENIAHSYGPESDCALSNSPLTSEQSAPLPVPEPFGVPDGPPLLLHLDPVCSLGSLGPSIGAVEPASFTEVIDNTTTQVVTALGPEPALNPKAGTFVPESLPSHTHVAASAPTPSTVEVSEESPARPPQASIHAPASKPAPVDDSKDTSFKAPIPTPSPQPEARLLRSSIHAPTLDIDNPSEVRSLHSSIHAPASYPAPRVLEPPNPHPTLSPTAKPFLPGAPKFFAQNYGSTRIIIAPAPPKKSRVRSPQMKERKRLQREAKEALARLAESGAVKA